MRPIHWIRCAAIFAALLTIALTIVACNRVELGVHMLIDAPNHGRSVDAARDPKPEDLRALGIAQSIRLEVGPPAASLNAYLVNPPADPPANFAGSRWPRGTVLYLHGIRDDAASMLPTARSHAERGYRGVVIDARGHGRSSGDFVTYGVQEVRDYQQLLDELSRRGLLIEPVAVYGASYGAGVAVQLAGRDPRIRTAVALAPFRSMESIARDRARSLGLSWFFDEATITRALTRAKELSGCDPLEADGVAAQRARPTPLLIFHGARDEVIPPAHSEAIAQAADPHAKRIVIANGTHYDWTDEGRAALWIETTAWLDEHLGR